jgi:hypothetical protein
LGVTVPANSKIGMLRDNPEIRDRTLTTDTLVEAAGTGYKRFVDFREPSGRMQHGIIPGSVHIPYNPLDSYLKPGGL